MSRLERERQLVVARIEAQRQTLALSVNEVARQARPGTILASLGGQASSRLGTTLPFLSLLGRGPGLATWLRVGAVAALAWPVVSALLRRRDERKPRGV